MQQAEWWLLVDVNALLKNLFSQSPKYCCQALLSLLDSVQFLNADVMCLVMEGLSRPNYNLLTRMIWILIYILASVIFLHLLSVFCTNLSTLTATTNSNENFLRYFIQCPALFKFHLNFISIYNKCFCLPFSLWLVMLLTFFFWNNIPNNPKQSLLNYPGVGVEGYQIQDKLVKKNSKDEY